LLINPRLQQKLDLAMVKQAVRDLWLRTDGFQMTKDEQEECVDLMLEAARWCFVDRHPSHVFSFRQVCQRLGLDPAKGALRLFIRLPMARRREIWRALRHYSRRHLPRSWQACQGRADSGHGPKGPRYLGADNASLGPSFAASAAGGRMARYRHRQARDLGRHPGRHPPIRSCFQTVT